MILTCPSCDTRYSVDGTKFPSQGRTVRCAKCGHSWHQDAEAPEPGPASAVDPAAAVAMAADMPGPAAPETAAARRALAQELRAAINDRQALRTLSSPRLAGWAAQVAAWAGL